MTCFCESCENNRVVDATCQRHIRFVSTAAASVCPHNENYLTVSSSRWAHNIVFVDLDRFNTKLKNHLKSARPGLEVLSLKAETSKIISIHDTPYADIDRYNRMLTQYCTYQQHSFNYIKRNYIRNRCMGYIVHFVFLYSFHNKNLT